MPHECDFTGAWNSDGTHHWHECSCGETDSKVAHSGGTATETEKARCTVCNTAYGELLPPSETTVSIADFNSNFTSYVSLGTTLKITGTIYAGDHYGLYITDENQNTVYVKFSHSASQMTPGQKVTFTGTANLYYSLPQFIASEAAIIGTGSINLEISTKTIAEIISENAAYSSKVFNHKIYRTTGVLTQEGSNYFLVDGESKIQIKTTSYSADFTTLLSYLNKKISVNLVISDCFSTTGIFRFSPLSGSSANIEEIEQTPGTENPPSANQLTDINFVMINDTHGAFTDSSQGYSIGRVDSLVEYLEATKGDYIFIHNGDAFQGSYVSGQTYGLAMIEALNASSLDCFVIGNHEFDWGIDKIAQYADGNPANGEADFPFLGANIYYKGTQTRPDWIDAYTIIEQDGIKVGIIGIIGDSHESSILTRYVKDYDFVNPIQIIKSTAEYLRNTAGCGVVVVATHDYDVSVNEDIAALSGSSRIDAIFCAHTHENITESVTRSDSVVIPVVQCSHKNQNAKEVVITVQGLDTFSSYTAKLHYPSSYDISDDVQTVIAKYSSIIDESNEVLGSASSTISKSTLGAYAVDAMLNDEYASYEFGDVDVAIINTGGVRATINQGDITRAEVFEVFPFNNAVVLVNIKGSLLKSLCQQNSSYFYIKVSSSIGSYSSLQDNVIYQLAVIDYVFEGTRYTQFSGLSADDYILTDIVMRDLLMVYLDRIYD